MRRVHVLHRRRHRFWRVEPFWYPLVVTAPYLRDLGLDCHFFTEPNDAMLDCDALFVSSHRLDLRNCEPLAREQSVGWLTRAKDRVPAVLWFDTEDSSGKTEFDVLPHVHLYVKNQLLRDRALYRQPLYSGRLFTDYYHREFGVDDGNPGLPMAPLPEVDEWRVTLGWNIGLADFRRGGPAARAVQIGLDTLESCWHGAHSVPWWPVEKPRDVGLVALFGSGYSRPSVRFQRERALAMLSERADPAMVYGRKLPARVYLDHLHRAQMVLSLYGIGEVCYREYEAFVAGAAVLMPDMSHLETWPDLYLPYETYRPVKWDLSDLLTAYEELREDPALRQYLARQAQQRYRDCWSPAGKQLYAARVEALIAAAADAASRLAGVAPAA